MTTIHNAWVVFEEMVIPENASKEQRGEMKKAFYGGVGQMLTIIMTSYQDGSDPAETVKLIQYAISDVNEFVKEQAKNVDKNS